jgi:RNA polymerase sigma factor (sigma-70 family)
MSGQVSEEGSHDSPDDLVRRAAGRDAEAFAGLIARYERTALSLAYAVTRDADAAGDVTQDAFLRAWQRLGELKDPARFGGWLCGIVRNLAADAVRRRRVRWRPLRLAASADDASPADDLARVEEAQRIDQSLAALDETTRSAVVLRYYEGLSSKRIAELLDLSPAAVDMRLSRARAELRSMLEPRMNADGHR